MKSDTIAAIATALSDAGIGIIRISGPEAIAVANRVVVNKKKEHTLKNWQTHTIHYGFVEENGTILDEVMVSVMKAPRSYTTEDTVEINCHGGVLLTKRVLEAVLHAGARMAEPGEFTKRAFLNGRIDLSQAEAVIDVINSKNNYALCYLTCGKSLCAFRIYYFYTISYDKNTNRFVRYVCINCLLYVATEQKKEDRREDD